MRINNFVGRERAQEMYEKIHNFDYFDVYLSDLITKEEYDKVNDELDRVKDELFKEMKEYDNSQKNK